MENEQDIESKRADSGADWMRLVKPLESELDDDCGFPSRHLAVSRHDGRGLECPEVKPRAVIG